MGEVWLGHHPSLNRLVAIKVLHPQLRSTDRFNQRFLQEARLVASLRHPNIVQLYDFDIDGDRPYMVMEYLQGGTLYDRLRRQPDERLSIPEATALISQIANGLFHAHQFGAVHRDLKPTNILFTKNGEPIVSDFGIAKLLRDEDLSLTQNVIIGTPSYMSPEQALSQTIDQRSDIYALGIILFEMLTGRLPFIGQSAAAILTQQVTEPPPSPLQFNHKLPQEIEEIILRALAKDPSKRYSHVLEIADALTGVRDDTQRLYATETLDDLSSLQRNSQTQSTLENTSRADLEAHSSPISSIPAVSFLSYNIMLLMAIANRPLAHSSIADMLGEKDETVLVGLDELWDLSLIISKSGREAYFLADPAYIDQIYAHANPAKKTLLHRRCADFFSQRPNHQENPISQWEIGSHYERGGQIERAASHYLLGMEGSIAKDVDHVEFRFEKLRSLVENRPDIRVDRCKLFWMQANRLSWQLGWEDELVNYYLKQSAEFLSQTSDPTMILNLLVSQWRLEAAANQTERAQDNGLAIREAAELDPRPQARSLAHLIIGLNLLEQRRFVTACVNFQRGLDLFVPDKFSKDRFLLPIDLGLLLRIALTHTFFRLGKLDEALKHQKQSILYAKQI